MYPPNARSMAAFDVLHPKLVHQIVLVQNPSKVCAALPLWARALYCQRLKLRIIGNERRFSLMACCIPQAPLKLRYRFTFTLHGQQKTEQGDVAGFPMA